MDQFQFRKMEYKCQKRLLKPTLPSEISIKSQLQICKLIIRSELSQKYRDARAQNKKTIDQSINLQWQYTKLTSRNQKLMTQSKQIDACKIENANEQIDKLNNQIKLKKSENLLKSKKIQDRQQLLVRDQQYWTKLKMQNDELKNQLQRINNQSQCFKLKKQKLCFVIKQILRNQSGKEKNFESLNKQKRQIKLKLQQKINGSKKELESNKILFKEQSMKLQKQIQLQKQLTEKIKNIQQTLIEKQLQKEKTLIQIKKIEGAKQEQKNYNFQLKQRLKIEQDRIESQKSRNKILNQSKQALENTYKKFVQQTYDIIDEIKKIQYLQMFENEHAKRVATGSLILI